MGAFSGIEPALRRFFDTCRRGNPHVNPHVSVGLGCARADNRARHQRLLVQTQERWAAGGAHVCAAGTCVPSARRCRRSAGQVSYFPESALPALSAGGSSRGTAGRGRGTRPLPKNPSLGQSSTMLPRSMKITRWATLRTKPSGPAHARRAQVRHSFPRGSLGLSASEDH